VREVTEVAEDGVHATPRGAAYIEERRALVGRQPYSQGQTEGQITRLKRTMYGRANFDLLRQRFLAPY
jgi:transposase